MAKQTSRAKGSCKENSPDVNDSTSNYEPIVGVDSVQIFSTTMQHIELSIYNGPNSTKSDARARTLIAAEMLKNLNPRDMQEGLLCAQMIATHYQLMECNRRAAHPEHTLVGRDTDLKNAAKLGNLFTKQMETLAKYRGKGQQKITVKHVHVHDGGQAIVGNVNSSTTGRNQTLPDNSHAVLPEPEQEAMQIIEPSNSANAKASNKK